MTHAKTQAFTMSAELQATAAQHSFLCLQVEQIAPERFASDRALTTEREGVDDVQSSGVKPGVHESLKIDARSPDSAAVLIRRELDEAAKGLGERIRTGEATCEVSEEDWLLKYDALHDAWCGRQGLYVLVTHA
jgi:hypothetical protein